MKGFVTWFASNPVAANLVMVVILVGGLMTTTSVKMELLPEFSLDLITVNVVYPGAAPEEVEEAICIRIEEEVHSLDGVKKVSSTASESVGTVLIEVLPGHDTRKVLDDVKNRIDAIDTFPEQAERPVVQEELMRQQVIYVAVSGQVEEKVLKSIGQQVRDELNAIDGITQVNVASARPYEISIEVSETQLRRFGLSFDEVAGAVRAGSLDLSGGTVKTRGGEILLRTKTQAYRGPEFEKIVLRSLPDGGRVLLGDVARVVDGFADTSQSSRFNGAPSVNIQVFRVGEENALDVAAAVHEYIKDATPGLPAGVKLTTWYDSAVFLQGRLDLLLNNAAWGLALVFLLLALFLRFRLAFWVTLGIPISFMGAVWMMPELGQSVNMLSLFAFILVLGIVVDDAIVVGESIFTERKKLGTGLASAISGTNRVAVPVTFAVLTTITAFAPMLALPGVMGKFFKVMPLVVIPTLAFSWLESKVILPAHLGHESRGMNRLSKLPPFCWWGAFQGVFERGMEWFSRHVYQPVLDRCLEWRYLTLSTAVVTLMLFIGIVSSGYMKMVFFPKIEGDLVSAQLTMPLGTSIDTTQQAVSRIEAAADKLRAELQRGEGRSVITNFVTAIGGQPFKEQQHNSGVPGLSTISRAHLAEITIELLPSEERTVRAEELADRWRELTGPIPGIVELLFTSEIMSAGEPINVRFAGQDIAALRGAAEGLKAELARYPGVHGVADSFRGGKAELELDILPTAEALGLTRADLARQVRQAFHGEEAQRIQRDRDDVKVMVRLPEADRQSLAGLETLRIRTPDGKQVPFSTVATARHGRGYATISRNDRTRTVTVTGRLSDGANANEILADLEGERLPALLTANPGVSYSLEGEQREQTETMEAMLQLSILAMLAIYALMAIPFKSYVQPLVVMLAIPFGIVGALLGHLVMGLDISIFSMMGIVALGGVVVNDSLVLVDFVNRKVRRGVELVEAARVAGTERFRPIMLTSLTTFAGLTPLILEKSVQAQFLVPMAVSLAFGVVFSTVISLVIVPAGYLILEDVKRLPSRLYGARSAERSEAA